MTADAFFGLEGSIAAVTGGSSGIGYATVRLLAQLGAKVAFCGRDESRLRRARDALVSEFSAESLWAASCDVLDAGQVERFARGTAERFGGVDILVNNAGQGRVSAFADTSDDAWQEELRLKFFSIIYPTRAFLPLLERSASPAIVCVNSLLAQQPEPHMVATSAARAGVLNLTRSLATEIAPKRIRVNSILVGLVDSAQWRRRYETQAERGETWEAWSAALAARKGVPLGRLGRPEEAAQAIVFLASPLASYTTGSFIDVSGGHSRHV